MPTPNTGIPYVPEGTLDPAAGLNDALRVIDALLQCSVLGFEDDPPVSPADGDQYIVGTGTGLWLEQDNNLAQWVDEGAFWQFYEAGTQLREVYDLSDFSKKGWNGSAWIVIGGLSDAPSDGNTYGRLDGAWAIIPASGGGASGGVQYAADTGSTADSDPGAGLMKWNNATQASATELYFDDTTTDSVSLTAWWTALEAGGFAYLQHATDQDTWQIWEITAVTDASGYVKFAVTLLADGGSFADDAPMLVTLQQGAGGGSGDVVGPASATADAVALYDGTTGKLLKDGAKTINDLRLQSFVIACSDETTNLTTGTAKATFRMPYAFTVTGVRGSLSAAQTAGSIFTVDINEAGTSILSSKLTIDNNEETSTTAATPPVISDSSLADDAKITIDIDQVGTAGAKGLKVAIIGYPT